MLLALLTACLHPTFVPHCDTTSTPLDGAAASALGFTPDVLAGSLGDLWSSPATVPDGDTLLTVRMLSWGQAYDVDLSPAPAPPHANVVDIGVVCEDYVAVDAELGVATSDGTLAETWAVVLKAVDTTQAAFDLTAETTSLQGSLDLSRYSMEGYDSASLSVQGLLKPAGETEGELTLLRETSSGSASTQLSKVLVTWGADVGSGDTGAGDTGGATPGLSPPGRWSPSRLPPPGRW